MESGQVPGHVVYFHFGAFKVVEFLPDGRFVSGRESRPGFVGVSVVIDGFRHLDVIVESNDAFFLQLFDGRSERQFAREDLLGLLSFPPPSFGFLVVHPGRT